MAVSSRARNTDLPLHLPRKFTDADDNTTTTITNKHRNGTVQRRVPVVYYLSRNGQLEHPHFIEVPLPSNTDGLYLHDVINRLNILRGKGFATLYSWSSKRSYKNGFVWHDLSENDFIYPAHGHEYVLKGSELLLLPDAAAASSSPDKGSLLEPTPSFRSSSKPPPDISRKSSSPSSTDGSAEFPAITRRRNQSWSNIDLTEYKVYKAESVPDSTRRLAANASTQTDEKKRRSRRPVRLEEEGTEIQEELVEVEEEEGEKREEIEISPPPSDSSPETLETLMKADGRLVLGNSGGVGSGGGGASEGGAVLNQTVGGLGRMRASTVLMQLISCGSMSFMDCGATAVKEQGLSLIEGQQGKGVRMLPRGGRNQAGMSREILQFTGVRLEDKEYFSGSLIETANKKEEVPALKRSNSYNENRL
ncbi:hypothetical protein Tsubulata_051035 [Turnera subulata]|uniref:SOSEKI DIX-like domain-containing protein n=1 Tax=Turnera subulata TaxID=218843 RepID=A0A9Q0FBH5_9ROSI|nr:hypothetical protein Tsubulata_051035 [Turnera subulata]